MPFLIAPLLIVLAPSLAYAYIGPAAGISAIGSFLALIGAVVLAIAGFVWYPIKRLMRGRAARANAASKSGASDSTRD
jgi:uncharacterized membrane protein YidH (DUF202 family)